MGTAKGRLAAVVALAAGLALSPVVAHGADARPTGPQPVPIAAPMYDDVAGAQLLASQINADRSANGLRPLTISVDLTAIAQAHSRRMAEAGRIWHNDELFTQSERARLGASRLGENVGFDGGGAVTSHQMYMDSAPHRANILDPRFTAMGIAVTVADGISYSTEDFMQAAAQAPAPAPTPAPAPKPKPAAPPTTVPAAPPTTAPAVPPTTTPAAPVGATGAQLARTNVRAEQDATPEADADASPRRVAAVATGRSLPSVPPPLAGALGLVNAALAWATVLAARRNRSRAT
jgi:uncharacterized protein YkwD